MPVHQFVQDTAPARPRPVQLLGLQHDRLLRAAQRATARRQPRRAGHRVQGDGQGAARGRTSRSSSTSSTTTPPRATSSGPTLAFRGIDNAAYYRLVDDDQAHYYDTTGTGNSLLMRHPHVLQLIMDSLRYWVTEMHVDGFRFDLAATLARQFHEVDRLSAFFDLVQQDPVVSQVKLIAEPWDVGDGGYQVGNFPPLWTEWNGKYRDTVRDFWRGEPRHARRVRLPAHRLQRPLRGRRPHARSPVDQLRHRATTASRCATWSPTTTSTTRPTARTTATARATTGPGTAASRARPTTRRSSRCAAPAAQLARHAAALPGRADDRCTATSSAAPSTATTTSTARTTRSPGSTGTSTTTRAAARLHRSRRPACAATTRCSAAGGSSPAAPTTAARPSSATSPGSARRRADGRRRLADGEARTVTVFLNGERHPRARHARAPDRRRLLPAGASTPTTRTDFTVLPGSECGRAWEVELDTGATASTPSGAQAGSALKVQPRSLIVLRSPREAAPLPSGAATTHRT